MIWIVRNFSMLISTFVWLDVLTMIFYYQYVYEYIGKEWLG